MEENKQVIEVDYDKKLVKDYQKNYIMEEEGTGANEAEPYDTQTNVNEVPFEEMNEKGEVIVEEAVENDKNYMYRRKAYR